ncbi:hypothetical protein ACI65C_004318 [Semiaphis heraclei]
MNTDWLNTIFEIPPLILQTLVSNSANIGRPVKMFMESSERTKRRKINNLITSSNMTSPEILYASNSKFQQHGQRSIVQHFKEVTSSPTIEDQIEQIYASIIFVNGNEITVGIQFNNGLEHRNINYSFPKQRSIS